MGTEMDPYLTTVVLSALLTLLFPKRALNTFLIYKWKYKAWTLSEAPLFFYLIISIILIF